MKKYTAKKEVFDIPIEETLFYNRASGCYQLTESIKCLEVAEIDKEDSLRYLAGEVKHIFPDYDSEKHVVKLVTYENEILADNGSIVALYEKVENDITLNYGAFIIKPSEYGTGIKELSIQTDKFIDIGRDVGIYQDFLNFKNDLKKYEQSGRRAKKAVLLYGPPGNGKTREICKLIEQAEELKVRIFFIDQNLPLIRLEPFKRVFKDSLNVFIFEEITERTRGSEAENLLSFLDGEFSWSNSYIIATTNYPEELPTNIIDRPSRFKLIKEVGNPNYDQRLKYLSHFNVNNKEEVAKETDGMSLDYLINLVQDSMLEDRDCLECVKEYKKRKDVLYKNFKSNKIGLG